MLSIKCIEDFFLRLQSPRLKVRMLEMSHCCWTGPCITVKNLRNSSLWKGSYYVLLWIMQDFVVVHPTAEMFLKLSKRNNKSSVTSPRFSEQDGCLDEHHDRSSTATTLEYSRMARGILEPFLPRCARFQQISEPGTCRRTGQMSTDSGSARTTPCGLPLQNTELDC